MSECDDHCCVPIADSSLSFFATRMWAIRSGVGLIECLQNKEKDKFYIVIELASYAPMRWQLLDSSIPQRSFIQPMPK